MRRKVEQYVCCGMSQDEIADVFGISDETLRKHFAIELQCGARKKRAEIIDMLFTTARKGNVTAQKKIEEMSRAVVAQQELIRAEETRPASARTIRSGKKEAAVETATSMLQDDEWGRDLAISMGIDPKRAQ